MQKFKVVVLELAKTDVRQARKWYNQQQAGLGKKLMADMTTILRKIAMNPTSFAVRYKVLHLAHFDIFQYAAHFYINGKNNIVVNSDTRKDRF
jgi:hypothetical protein